MFEALSVARARAPDDATIAAVVTATGVRPATAPSRTARVWLTVRACGFAGVCAGSAQLVAHDGHGGLRIDDRPFVLGPEAGRVDLGVAAPTPASAR